MRNWLILVLVSLSLSAIAHEIRPAYLQITETSENQFDVYWRIPSRGEAIPRLEVIFPSGTSIINNQSPVLSDGFANFNYTISTNEPLAGKPIRIDGLQNTLIDALVRLEYRSGEQVTIMLQPDRAEVIIPGETTTWQVIQVYTILGVEHILFGYDHLLFVLALIIIARGKWKIVKTVTAFTIAHSITLSLASLGLVFIPGAPVEAVIALSIVYLALEILQLQKGEPTLTSRKPWLVAFTFGLLHGFGFAGALSEIGLPQQAIPWALAFFNIGVELGQLAFVFALLLLFAIAQKLSFKVENTQRFTAYAIGSVAAFWMIERVVGFWA